MGRNHGCNDCGVRYDVACCVAPQLHSARVVDALPSTVPWTRSESLVVQSLIELPAAAGHDARTELLRFHQEMCAFLSSGSTHSLLDGLRSRRTTS